MQQNNFSHQKFGMALLPLSSHNMKRVLTWRNLDFVRANMLNQNKISVSEHNAWFEKVCENQSECHFVIYYKEQPIGAANLKADIRINITQAKSAESGLYICDEAIRGSAYAFLPSLLLLEFGFETLKLETINAVVLSHNTSAVRFNLQQGYEIVEENSDRVTMCVTSHNFQTKKQKLYRFFNR